MKQLICYLFIAGVTSHSGLTAAQSKPAPKATDREKIERAIRLQLKKPTGILTAADYKKVKRLDLQALG
ncbi:uncharacterized protein METZ01_LOCUS434711, partial [marine metagenome]